MTWDWGDWIRRYHAGDHPPLPVDNSAYYVLQLRPRPQNAALASQLWKSKATQFSHEDLRKLVTIKRASKSAVTSLVNETKVKLALPPHAIQRARGGTYPVDWKAIGDTVAGLVRRHVGAHPDHLLERLTQGSTATGLWLGIWACDPSLLLDAHRDFLQTTLANGTNRLHVLAAAEFYRDTNNLLDSLKLGERVSVDSSLAPTPPGAMLIVRSHHGADGAIYLLTHSPTGWSEQRIGGREDAANLFAQFERLRHVSPKPPVQAVIA